MAARIQGSPDLYARNEREPEKSINFITCHDGFTLNDVVSYNQKHNERNGEENRDGTDDNRSWNCGGEGLTNDPEVERLRKRQVKNFLTTLFLSAGAPMLLMGDEVRRTQQGNNNAYCQDNEISWFDWNLLDRHPDVLRFTRMLVASRLQREVTQEHGLTLNEILRRAQVRWHGIRLDQPDWGYDSHTLACTLRSTQGKFLIHAMINAYWDSLCFELPLKVDNGALGWHRWIDTALEEPDDICEWEATPLLEDSAYTVQPRSTVVLFAAL